jgi:hypothetical protein
VELSPDVSVASAKHILSAILNIPFSRFLFVHCARILDDRLLLGSLDFSTRDFISVTVRKSPRHSILRRELPSPDVHWRSLIYDLTDQFGDGSLSIRDQILRDPPLVAQIMTEFSRSYPQNANYLIENPQLLLEVFDIRPAEFAQALSCVRASGSDLVSDFLAGLTTDDLLALERVMSTNLPLNLVIPIFVGQNKDVGATIEQINRLYGNREIR